MNAFKTRLKTASLLFALQWVGVTAATEPDAQSNLTPFLSTLERATPQLHASDGPTDGKAPLEIVSPSENFDAYWVTYPDTETLLPKLHLSFRFRLNTVPDAAIIETVAGIDGIVRLGHYTAKGNRHVARELRADQEEKTVDSVKLTSPEEVFVKGINFVEVVCRDVKEAHGVIALLQLRVAGVAVTVGTDESTWVSLDGKAWKKASKRHEFDSANAPVAANTLAADQAYIRQYAQSLVVDCQASDPSVAGDAIQQLTRLAIKNGGSRYSTNRYLYRENVLWTLRDQYLETLTTHLQSSNRNLQLNALRALTLFLDSDAHPKSVLAGAGAIALMPSSIKMYAEPTVLSALQRSVIEFQTKRSTAAVKLAAAENQAKEAKQAAANASAIVRSATAELQILDAEIEETDQLVGKATANIEVANQISDGLTKTIGADQAELRKLDAQSDQAKTLRDKIEAALNQLRDQASVIGVNELRIKGLETEAKSQVARRIELKAAVGQAEATLVVANTAETKANQSVETLKQNVGKQNEGLLQHLTTIEAFLDLHSFETLAGRMLVLQLHQVIDQTRLTLYKVELAAADETTTETFEMSHRGYGASASASMIPTASDRSGIRSRPGISRPAPYDSGYTPRDRSVNVRSTFNPNDERSRAGRLLRDDVQAGTPGADSPAEPAPGGSGATSAIPVVETTP
ncbi:DUF4407 domain-containing protein [Roseiconus lacunae]|uniref:DUF4407 domain-containing protein n=1 Tax=Roseiconus lacunae TaxID=2605694 RepID=UPI001E5C0CE6|nr:DUF4407 domain-containing protein [Roseiconus lacunae]MCD0461295.1 DUF4407 domain-containing protein [Roseiconus lacunae]